jgi:hypothetical protein
MKTSTEIQAEIRKLNEQIEPLQRARDELKREESEVLSREFIAANNITLDDIEMSNGEEKPWFGHAYAFGEWLKTNSKKPWAEWNGGIYHAADLINKHMRQTNGMVSTLEKP